MRYRWILYLVIFIFPKEDTYIYTTTTKQIFRRLYFEQNRPKAYWAPGRSVVIKYGLNITNPSRKLKGQLHIQKVVHGFYQITGDSLETRGYNDSSSCNYDVNCDIGYDFQ